MGDQKLGLNASASALHIGSFVTVSYPKNIGRVYRQAASNEIKGRLPSIISFSQSDEHVLETIVHATRLVGSIHTLKRGNGGNGLMFDGKDVGGES